MGLWSYSPISTYPFLLLLSRPTHYLNGVYLRKANIMSDTNNNSSPSPAPQSNQAAPTPAPIIPERTAIVSVIMQVKNGAEGDRETKDTRKLDKG